MSQNNVLITGITGSGGSYLAEYILTHQSHVNVWGTTRWHSTTTSENIQNIREHVNLQECDLMDLSSIIRTLQVCKPKKIFHFASYANVRKCFDTPLSVVNNNVIGTANLLEAIRLTCPTVKFIMTSTSKVYGDPLITPMSEEHPIKPIDPYAVSKLTQEGLAYAYFKNWGFNIVITRMFAYINPRRDDLFATSFAKQIINIENKKQSILKHGNLQSVRTLIDVRDAMEAHWIASEKCKSGEAYNIGGKSIVSIGDFLMKLKSMSTVKIHSELDVNLLRPTDVVSHIPDLKKFTEATLWQPKYSLDDSISFLLKSLRDKQQGG